MDMCFPMAAATPTGFQNNLIQIDISGTICLNIRNNTANYLAISGYFWKPESLFMPGSV